ncbi:MAG: Crp/Fnr family transcriptional regulator [Armatimonadota bacterium]
MGEIHNDTVSSALRRCNFLAKLSEDDLIAIRLVARRVRMPKNRVLFHEGDPCHGFYIVEAGAVRLYKESRNTREHTLHIALPGDCFGEAALFLDTGYPASAATVKDSSLVFIRRDEFLNILKSNPRVSFALMGSMALWAHRLVNSIELLTLKDAGERLASYLLAKCPDSECKPVIELEVTKRMLASHLGITGETLSRLLARFEAEGFIEVVGRKIRILSLKGLRRLSGAAGHLSRTGIRV